jgi:hypothetical protein
MEKEEKKLTVPEAVQHISNTLTRHAEIIQAIQEKLDSIQPQIQTQLASIEDKTQQTLVTIETNLKTVLHEKVGDANEMMKEIRSLHHDVSELGQLLHNPGDNRTSTPNTSQQSSTHDPTPIPPLRVSNDQTSTNLTYFQPTTSIPSTIIVPPISSFPTFAGKPTDRPRQFLLRVAEYTQTVNKWSTETLLKGISQFLKESALDWYCQLHVTDNLPTTWEQFVKRFLAQFHSPIRIAQQEHEWDECKQQENETINEFVVRLRSLWLEQKPEEKENDFIKHLFCKMRPDMLTLMNVNRSSTLKDIITEDQQLEEILYLRNKEARRRTNQRSKPNASTPLLTLNTQTQYSSRNTQSPSTTTPTCWRCYETGHYATTCPLNDTRRTYELTDYSQQPLPQRSKNT